MRESQRRPGVVVAVVVVVGRGLEDMRLPPGSPEDRVFPFQGHSRSQMSG